MGPLDPRIEPPIEVQMVSHEPWQQEGLRFLKEKLKHRLVESSQGPYRSRYFPVKKKEPGAWQLINDVQSLDKVTIQDAGMPPAVNEFSEEFAGHPIIRSIDFYSGCNQILLDEVSRGLAAFMLTLGLLRSTILPMGWINSMAVFPWVTCKVLCGDTPQNPCGVFLDDLGICGPQDRYGDKEALPGSDGCLGAFTSCA
jgi:hypothetical protein